MIGRIMKKQKGTSKIEYFFFSSLSDELLAQLRNDKEVSLFCDCKTGEKIELKVGKRNDYYYLYNAKQGLTDSHHPRCIKFSNYVGKSDYEKGWMQEEDVFIATLHDEIFATGEKENPEGETSKKPYQPGAKSRVNPTKKQGEVTLLGLATKLNLITWEKCARNKSLPQDRIDFLKKVYGAMKKIKITNNKRIESLQTMNYEYKKSREMKPKKSFLFVYMRFCKVTVDPFHRESVKVQCEDTFGHERYFSCEKAKFSTAYESLRFENKEKQTLMVAGFVYKASETSSLLNFSSICLFVTNKLGLYSESSYELETYDKLCDAKRVFYKPYFSLPEYDDLRPDILFLDTEKPVIGEIFGFTSQEYLEERVRKLTLADELKENYGFWKWDAYRKDPFPEFPVRRTGSASV